MPPAPPASPAPSTRIRCPLCRVVIEDAPADFAPRPFCSAQCKLTDLHNWLGLGESYRISGPIESSPLGADDDGSSTPDT